jgi:hypothetical protein
MDMDSYVQYKAMIISLGMHGLLLMFELLACDKLQNNRAQVNLNTFYLDILNKSKIISNNLIGYV